MSKINSAFLSIAFRLQNGINNIKKLPKIPEWKYPWAIEKEYEIAMVKYINVIRQYTNEVIIPAIPGFKKQFNFSKGKFDGINIEHYDDYNSDLEVMFNNLNVFLIQNTTNPGILALDIGQKTNKWNSKEWQKILKSVLGVNGFAMELGIEQIMKNFVNGNIKLIINLTNEAERKIQLIFNNGIIEGQRIETIVENLKKSLDISENRARFIARDQIGKLNGMLTEERQTTYGITDYYWRDSNDIKVRLTHSKNNGKKFSWDRPPVTGHPGFDFQCRCWAEPDFKHIFGYENRQPINIIPVKHKPKFKVLTRRKNK